MAVFVDTGAWFAYFVRRDTSHAAAVAWMQNNRQPLTTTDYVLDELLTLLRVRESHHVANAAGEAFRQQRVARIEHITVEDVVRAWEVFRGYDDKEWSFLAEFATGLTFEDIPFPVLSKANTTSSISSREVERVSAPPAR